MRNLNIDALAVESFSTSVEGDPSQWTALAEPTTGTMTYAFSCAGVQYPVTHTEDPVCEDMAVAAMTVERICTTTR